jgi:diphosphomevalonate decarboxylase
VTRSAARAVAHSNIALAKYWGKADVSRNLTAVPSLSLTLAGLRTITRVEFDPELREDEGTLGGVALSGKPLARVKKLLDRVRGLAGIGSFARVESSNDFRRPPGSRRAPRALRPSRSPPRARRAFCSPSKR